MAATWKPVANLEKATFFASKCTKKYEHARPNLFSESMGLTSSIYKFLIPKQPEWLEKMRTKFSNCD
jgi:hypothetical protein